MYSKRNGREIRRCNYTRPGLGVYCTFDGEYYRYRRKDGKLGGVRWRHGGWYTPLFTCQLCDFTSTPKKVTLRNDLYMERWGTPILCVGCWNKLKPVANELRQLETLRAAAKKLKRVRYG